MTQPCFDESAAEKAGRPWLPRRLLSTLLTACFASGCGIPQIKPQTSSSFGIATDLGLTDISKPPRSALRDEDFNAVRLYNLWRCQRQMKALSRSTCLRDIPYSSIRAFPVVLLWIRIACYRRFAGLGWQNLCTMGVLLRHSKSGGFQLKTHYSAMHWLVTVLFLSNINAGTGVPLQLDIF